MDLKLRDDLNSKQGFLEETKMRGRFLLNPSKCVHAKEETNQTETDSGTQNRRGRQGRERRRRLEKVSENKDGLPVMHTSVRMEFTHSPGSRARPVIALQGDGAARHLG